ncbi:hypothetical protein NXY56_007734 [Leishmania guyanensis]|uniref:Uncharacterized protein n=1 Tax=Leishmania shawi TaxID=5680 RepID=A0AAW3B754_9TRYP
MLDTGVSWMACSHRSASLAWTVAMLDAIAEAMGALKPLGDVRRRGAASISASYRAVQREILDCGDWRTTCD